MDSEAKRLIRTEFLAFAMKTFAGLNKGRKLGNDKYLKLLTQTLTRVANGETKRLVINLPPRHFKTFMGSICLPAWILAHNPSAKIIILTYGQDLADKNCLRHSRDSAQRMVSANFQYSGQKRSG
jgi:hypothetical protein